MVVWCKTNFNVSSRPRTEVILDLIMSDMKFLLACLVLGSEPELDKIIFFGLGRGEEGGTWWGKIRSVTPTIPDNVPLLKTEVQALEELSRFLFLEAHELQNALERITWSKTCQAGLKILTKILQIYT